MKVNNFIRFIRRYSDVVCSIGLGIGIFLLISTILGFLQYGFGIPYTYGGGDDFLVLMDFKTFLDNGWGFYNQYIGAPFGADLLDFPSVAFNRVEFLISKIISLFSDNVFVIFNVQYVLIFSLAAISAFWVLRELKMRRRFAVFGAVLFGLAPFIFARSQGHFFVSCCYMVPFSILLCVWAYSDDPNYLSLGKSFFRYRKNLLFLIFIILIANNGMGYYAFFTCFFLCVVAVCNLIGRRSIGAIKRPMITIGAIVIIMLFAFIPVIINFISGDSNAIISRSLADAELYSLKIVQLLMPINGHGIESLENIIQTYNSTMPLVNENFTSYLGIGAIVGFFVSLVCLFARSWTGKSEFGKSLFLYSRLIIGAIIFFTIGGLMVVIYPVLSAFRGFNRVSIFIMFIGICVTCGLMQAVKNYQFKKNCKIKQKGISLLMMGFVLLCLYDQIPVSTSAEIAAHFTTNEQVFASDKKFVAEIESLLEEGDMVFQLPYHSYPEAGPVNQMADYSLFRGYLHSKSLRWSYGAVRGSAADQWNQAVSMYRYEMSIDILINWGFRGIYIDTSAYVEEELNALKNQIESVIHTKPLISDNGQLIFYNLYPHIAKHPEILNSERVSLEDLQRTKYFEFDDLNWSGDISFEADGSVLMSPGAYQYGPYIALDEGTYSVEIVGENLNGSTFDVACRSGQVLVPIDDISQEDGKISFTFTLTAPEQQMEIRLYNTSKNEMVRFEYTLLRQP